MFLPLFVCLSAGSPRAAGEDLSSVQERDRHGEGPEGLRAEEGSVRHGSQHQEGRVRNGLPAAGTTKYHLDNVRTMCELLARTICELFLMTPPLTGSEDEAAHRGGEDAGQSGGADPADHSAGSGDHPQGEGAGGQGEETRGG